MAKIMSSVDRNELNKYMERLVDGDRNAFDYVYAVSWPLVHRLALKTIGQGPDAEEVAQQSLMKVFSRASEFEKGRDALSWILGITSFECKTARQKVKRRKEDFHSEDRLALRADPKALAEEQLVLKSLEDAIQDALEGLSPQDQETIKTAIHELDRPNIPGATFRKRLERAFDRLKDKWREEYE